MAEKMIERKIDEAASLYGNAHIKNALKLDRDATFNEKCIPKFDAYSLETAFLLGANFALSQQWVGVEDALPLNDGDVLVALGNGDCTFVGVGWCSSEANGTKRWYSSDDNLDMSMVRFWMPIPPLPEARKEGEV